MFHNASLWPATFPAYRTIAVGKSGCARSTVAEAIKALEFAGVLTWQNRITRILASVAVICSAATTSWRWRVIRTSNASVFQDPKEGGFRPFLRFQVRPGTGTPQSREFSKISQDWCCVRANVVLIHHAERWTETR